jgi:hypothetical protein
MATSAHTHDFMLRELQNETPSSTDPVKDYLGRNTTATVDFLGRALQTPD